MKHCLQISMNIFLIVIFLLAQIGSQPARAAAAPDAGPIRFGYSDDGNLNFVGGSSESPLLAAGEVSAETAEQTVISRYSAQFGLADAVTNLRIDRVDQSETGKTTRYQQMYEGIPVIGGELILNEDTQGNVISLNGEVSPNLALKTTTPAVTADEALQTALAGMQEWYQLTPESILVGQPVLSIYDERILKPGDAPVALVWRMDLSAVTEENVVNELVLVDAADNTVLLHFNQANAFSPQAGVSDNTAKEVNPAPAAQTETAIWYVSTQGSQENDCITPATPCRYLQDAANRMTGNDLILMAGGTYYENGIDLNFGSPQNDGRRKLKISGEWNETFTAQDQKTIVDGEGSSSGNVIYNYSYLDLTISHMIFANSHSTVIGVGYTNLVVENSAFYHNERGLINVHTHDSFAALSDVKIINTTIADNSSSNLISLNHVNSVTIQNTTIVNNPGTTFYLDDQTMTLAIKNSVIANNHTTGTLDCTHFSIYQNTPGQVSSNGYNLFLGEFGCGFEPAATDMVGVDPRFKWLEANGTYGLFPDSPLIDAGSPLEPGSNENACEAADQLGTARPIDGNGDGTAACDIGAFETPLPQPADPINIILLNHFFQNAYLLNNYDPLTVQLKDQNGVPLANIPVTFTAPTEGPSGTFGDSSSMQVTVATDSLGKAVTPAFTANNLAGSFIVEISADGAGQSLQIPMRNHSRSVSKYYYRSGSEFTKTFGVFSSGTLPFNNIVFLDSLGGFAVATATFTAPSAGASLTFDSTGNNAFTTQINGWVIPNITTNGFVGSYPVIYTVEGVATQFTFTVTNVALVVSSTGWDTHGIYQNDCLNPAEPCKTINYALQKHSGYGYLYLAAETFGETFADQRVLPNILGGWTQNFSVRNQRSVIKNTNPKNIPTILNEEIKSVDFENIHVGIISNHLLVEDSSFRDTVTWKTSSCVSDTDSYSRYATIRNVTFYNCDTAINISLPYYLSSNWEGRFINVTIVGTTTAAIVATGTHRNKYYLQNSIVSGKFILNEDYPTLPTSLGYNIFSEVPSGFVPAPTDLIGVDPQLYEEIGEVYYAAPRQGSPAIDAIDPADPNALCLPADQIGTPRPVGGKCDIGAIESLPFGPATRIIKLSGDQNVVSNMPPVSPLQVKVTDAGKHPVAGEVVTFTAPASGASGVFADSKTFSTTVVTDSNGLAQAPEFIVNDVGGNFVVHVSIAGDPVGQDIFLTEDGPTRYVDHVNGDDGVDSANTCLSVGAPCKTIENAYKQAVDGDAIRITAGSQSGLTIDENGQLDYQSLFTRSASNVRLYVSGGWNSTFDAQIGFTTLEGYSISVRNSGDRLAVDHINLTRSSTPLYNTGTVDFRNGSVTNSFSGYVGGVITNQGTMKLTNITVSNNLCRDVHPYPDQDCARSDVVLNKSGKLTLNHATIAHNFFFQSWEGNGLVNYKGQVTIQNSILAGNRSTNHGDCGGTITSLGNNLVSNIKECNFERQSSDIVGGEYRSVNPLLGDLTEVDGTFVMPLMTGSPAIDAAGLDGGLSFDQRGGPRPVGEGYDIGAYEGEVPFALPQENVAVMEFFYRYGYIDSVAVVCSSPNASCTGSTQPDAEPAYTYTRGMFSFFRDHFQRNSIDGAGMTVASVINYRTPGTGNWAMDMIFLGSRYSRADDAVGHEYAHGVLQYSYNPFNYYQSGAIAESLADLWGEYYDQTNGKGNDSAAVKWLIGEDLPFGVQRNMQNPPAYLHPDSTASKYYWKQETDNGGIHINSGVNNKAVYLMVQGDTFNGITVSPIGWEKTGAIYYYTQQNLLTNGANYIDLYNDLLQACRVLQGGAAGITAADCVQVKKALDAVKMNVAPSLKFTPAAPDCPNGSTRSTDNLFFDGLENGAGQWEFGYYDHGSDPGSTAWDIVSDDNIFGFVFSGNNALRGSAGDEVNDTYAAMINGVTIPTNAKVYLRFDHLFQFDYGSYSHRLRYRDGGVLEYSTDDGATWKDAKALMDAGQKYNHVIFLGPLYSNPSPLKGRYAFTGDSHGYVSTRLKLTPLAGKSVKFRWRIGTNYAGGTLGWRVDNVAIYTCNPNPPTPTLQLPAHTRKTTTLSPQFAWKAITSADHYELQVATDAAFYDLVLNETDIRQAGYLPSVDLPAGSKLYWRVRAVSPLQAVGNWTKAYWFTTP